MMKKFGLLGRKLGHSFSPQIHRFLGDYEYHLYEREPEEIADFMADDRLNGFNVTIPYKETVIPYCDVLSDTVKKIGAVNTVLRRDGQIEGHNTDYYGFSFLLKRAGIHPEGKKALIFGSGGSSKTVSAVLHDMGASEIVIISRTGENNYKNLYLHQDAAVLINTTPVGMYPKNGDNLVSLENFPHLLGVVDIIYNPSRTKILLDAQRLGIPCINGLPMLVAQAKKSAEIFLSKKIEDEVIERIVQVVETETKNIALIGMPGCGKSTIGAALASKCGRKLIEMDALIAQRAGKSIEKIFSEDGEDEFRRIETEVLADYSKESGLILSTGGGIVERERNLDLLRQNSTIIFLDRDFSLLPFDGRPLSKKYGIDALAKKRVPLYRAWCDIAFPCVGVEETAENIRKKFNL